MKRTCLAGLGPARPAWSVTAGLALCLVLSQAAAQDRPPVIAQRYDDDCGIAALRMLLQRAGTDVDDSILAGLVDGDTTLDALSSFDLQEIVTRLGLGYRLNVGFVDVETATSLARFEPFIVLLEPSAVLGEGNISHFVLVEGVTAKGWLVADPVLSSRATIPFEKMEDHLHGKTVAGRETPMILRLARDGEGIAQLIAPAPADDRAIALEGAYRQPRSLPPGKTILTTGLEVSRSREMLLEDAFDETSGLTYSVGVIHGFSSAVKGRLTVQRATGNAELRYSDVSLAFLLDEVTTTEFGLDYIPSLPADAGIAVAFSANVVLDDRFDLSYGALSANLSHATDHWSAAVETTLINDGTWRAQITPSVTYSTALKQVALDVSVAFPYDVRSGEMRLSASASAVTRLNPDLSLAVSLSEFRDMKDEYRANSLSINMIYAVPRRFRN